MDRASVIPTTSESTMIIHGCTRCRSSSTTIAVGQSIWIDWKKAMTRRRSERSARAPPTRVSSQTGAFMANESSPIRNEEAPRVKRSHGSATCWAQVPMLERRLANQKVPKRLVARRPSDSLRVLITKWRGGSGARKREPGAQAARGRGLENDRAAVELRQIAHDREARARSPAPFRRRARHAGARHPASTESRPGPSSSTVMTISEPLAADASVTRDFAHLQALSRRLPSISSRSSRSHAHRRGRGDREMNGDARVRRGGASTCGRGLPRRLCTEQRAPGVAPEAAARACAR